MEIDRAGLVGDTHRHTGRDDLQHPGNTTGDLRARPDRTIVRAVVRNALPRRDAVDDDVVRIQLRAAAPGHISLHALPSAAPEPRPHRSAAAPVQAHSKAHHPRGLEAHLAARLQAHEVPVEGHVKERQGRLRQGLSRVDSKGCEKHVPIHGAGPRPRSRGRGAGQRAGRRHVRELGVVGRQYGRRGCRSFVCI